MGLRPRRPCKRPGCPNPSPPGKDVCESCATRERNQMDRRRGSSSTRGYGRRHRNTFRAGVLKRDRICVLCRAAPATVADHWPLSRKQLVTQGLDPNAPANGRGLCHPCHSTETALNPQQRGGWNAQR